MYSALVGCPELIQLFSKLWRHFRCLSIQRDLFPGLGLRSGSRAKTTLHQMLTIPNVDFTCASVLWVFPFDTNHPKALFWDALSSCPRSAAMFAATTLDSYALRHVLRNPSVVSQSTSSGLNQLMVFAKRTKSACTS